MAVVGQLGRIERGQTAERAPVAGAHRAVVRLVLLDGADDSRQPIVLPQVVAVQVDLEARRRLAPLAGAAGQVVAVQVKGRLILQHPAGGIMDDQPRSLPEVIPPGFVSAQKRLAALADSFVLTLARFPDEAILAAERGDPGDKQRMTSACREGKGTVRDQAGLAFALDGQPENPSCQPAPVVAGNIRAGTAVLRLVGGHGVSRILVPEADAAGLVRVHSGRRVFLQAYRHRPRRPPSVMNVDADQVVRDMRGSPPSPVLPKFQQSR